MAKSLLTDSKIQAIIESDPAAALTVILGDVGLNSSKQARIWN
jgi:hypothetical protein